MAANLLSSGKLQENIPKYYIAMFFRNLWITMPISILYYQDQGLLFTEMAIIEASISAVIFLTDIPSGAFADIFGRRLSTSLGFFLWGSSLILTGVLKSFIGFLFAALLMGLGDSLLSGALSALFYDTLKEIQKEDQYVKYIGRKDLISAIAIIISATLGGILYRISIYLPFFTHGGAQIISGIIILTMKEPDIPFQEKNIQNQIKLITHSLGFTFKTPKVRFITMVWICIVCVPMFFVNLMEQPYLQIIGIPVVLFGIIFAVTRGVIGFFAPLRYQIEKKIGERNSFYFITMTYICIFLMMVFITHWSSVFLLFFLFFTRDYSWTILDKYANDHIPSERRATVLSIINFSVNLVYLGGVLGIGYLLDHFTIWGLNNLLSTILVLIAFCVGIILPYLGWNYKKMNKALSSEL